MNLNSWAFIFIGLVISKTSYCQNIEKVFQSNSYSEAQGKDTFIKFGMESTKVGIITTHFDGYVKKFTVTGKLIKNNISSLKVKFPINEMDTDVDARNEKMWGTCLGFDENKGLESSNFITIFIKNSIALNIENQIIEGDMEIRGARKPIKINISIKNDSGHLSVKGNTQIKLSELEIPDPSILIASVNDNVDISFSIKEL